MKSIAAILAAIALGANSLLGGNVIYKEDGLTVEEIVPAETSDETDGTDDTDSIREPVAEEDLYKSCDIIADVTVNSVKEVSIKYNFMGTECVSYKTIAEVTSNVIYCSFNAEPKNRKKFTAAIADSSYFHDSGFPEITAGKRYIFFAENTDKLNDSLKLDRYSECFVSSPVHIIEINGEECTADNIFSAYSKNSKPEPKYGSPAPELSEGEVLDVPAEISSERCTMPLKDFEKSLAKKAKETKKFRAKEIDPVEMSYIQRNASMANQKLYESFDFKNDYIYPKDFAGTFVDFDKLHVLVTRRSAVNKYRELLADYSKYVTFDIVKYSYNELAALNEKCVKELEDNNFSITMFYVDVDKNKGVITVLEDEYEKAAAYAAEHFDGDMIEIEGGQYVVLD